MHVLRGKPSPAMVVAVCALAFAMVGTAVAGTDGLNAKITKSKVKSIAKKQADKELKANVAGSHVNLADKATAVDPNGVDSAAIQANAVTTAKIADSAVTTTKIQANAVTTAKIADAAITTTKLADNSVNSAKVVDDSITNADLGPGSVHASELGPAHFVFVTSVAIANNAVVSATSNCPVGERML